MNIKQNPYFVRGFTLIELAIVLVILGIFAGMAIPAFLTAIKQQQLRSAAQNIANNINYARSEAIRKGQAVYIYPAYFRVNGKLNGTATSWQEANGVLAFMDDLSNRNPNNIGKFNSSEALRSTQVKKTISLKVEAVRLGGNSSGDLTNNELGLIIFPSSEMKVILNYQIISRGSSGYIAKIILRDKINTKLCNVTWVDAFGQARACGATSRSKKTAEYIRTLCQCDQPNEQE